MYGATVEVVESLGGHERGRGRRARAGLRARPLPARPVLQPGQPRGPPHGRPARRSSRRWTARSTCSSPASGRAGRSPARARRSRPTTRRRASSPSSRSRAPCSPAARPGPHRIQGIGAGFVPSVLNREILDEIIPVPDEAAIETRAPGGIAARASSPGCRAAPRCGARCRSPRARSPSGKRIVCVLPDSGERYISAPFFAPAGLTGRRRLVRRGTIRGVLGLGTLAPRRRRAAPRRRARRTSAIPRRAASSSLEILTSWPGVHALLVPPRRARAARGRPAGRAALDRLRQPRADRHRDPSRRRRSATGSSSTTARAS